MDIVFLTGIGMKKTPITKSPRRMMIPGPKGPKSIIGAIMCMLQKELIRSHRNWAKMLEISFMPYFNPR